jgi:ABC-type methionine transport system ATPase subunit
MAVETKLQAVEEMCNQVLVTGKGEIRRQRQEFFAEQKLRLQETMNACTERFNAEMERRFEALDKMRVEHMRKREEERLIRAVDEFHDMLEQLGADFLAIIHEGVSSRA